MAMKIVRNLIVFILVIVLIALGVAFFSINTLIKKGFETAGPRVAKVETRLGGADILPFTGTGSLSKIFVGNPEGAKTPYALKIDAVKVAVNLPSLKTNTLIIKSVRVSAPDIYIEGGLTGKNNLSTIAKNIAAFSGSPEKPGAAASKNAQGSPKATGDSGKKVIITDLLITNAKVRWVSALTLGQEVSLPLPDIHLQNIGQGSHGITPSELSKLVLDEIFKAASTVSGQNTGKEVEQIKAMGKEKLNQTTNGLKELFHK